MSNGELGLREHKKRRTRAALVDTALRLFAERGYDQVTVAEIAASAGVSTRTYFGYFRHKGDVLFAGASDRLAAIGPLLAAQAAAGAAPIAGLGEALRAVLQTTGEDLLGSHRDTRLQLIRTRPDLQERGIHLLGAARNQLVGHLTEAYRDRYAEPGDAEAIVGGLLGAMVAVVTHGITEEHPPERIRAALERVFLLFERLDQIAAR